MYRMGANTALKWIAGLLLIVGCTTNGSSVDTQAALPVSDDGGQAQDSSGYQVKFETSQGDFVIQVHSDWAPKGAARFKELVEGGFYNDCRFFRVISGFMCQFGINGDPEVMQKWRDRRITDDPVKESNTRGRITFATSGPNSRTTQVFINFGNNAGLDGQGFAPFGEVIKGMDVVDKLYAGYGEGAPRGRGPDQSMVQQGGNEYLKASFPKLDYIKKASVLK